MFQTRAWFAKWNGLRLKRNLELSWGKGHNTIAVICLSLRLRWLMCVCPVHRGRVAPCRHFCITCLCSNWHRYQLQMVQVYYGAQCLCVLVRYCTRCFLDLSPSSNETYTYRRSLIRLPLFSPLVFVVRTCLKVATTKFLLCELVDFIGELSVCLYIFVVLTLAWHCHIEQWLRYAVRQCFTAIKC